MRRVSIVLSLAVLGALAAATPAAAGDASLPEVRSGERPGPPLLYEQPPTAPQLSLAPPFRAEPLLVSGTDAYRGGEYLYQDYIFDDRGADTREGMGTSDERNPAGTFSPTAGDVLYPTARRFAGNAADLVELRVKPTRRAIVYRATLNTARDADTAVVGIGIDTDLDGSDPEQEWPNEAGVSSPGLDAFVTAWGVDGEVTDFGTGRSRGLPQGAVDIDLRTNQMTIRVPRRFMDPGTTTWRYVAGVGLWNPGQGRWKQVPAKESPTRRRPASGDSTEDAPAVLNLAFRFDEPQLKSQGGSLDEIMVPVAPYTTFPGVGNWFEDKQALALSQSDPSTEGSTGGVRWNFSAEIDFGRLAAGADERLHRPGRQQARLMSSSLDLREGFRLDFPQFGGALQPYMLTVPESYRRSDPSGLTYSLHSLGGTYTQFAVFSPNQLEQFGDDRDDLVATPLGRGPDGWYIDEAEVDFFEVWRDVADHFRLDPKSVALSGYSMGGYGTYRLGVYYPDLFGKAFTTVGPPARGVWPGPGTDPSGGANTNTYPLLENARWLPYMNWVEASDELVPYTGTRAQQNRFDNLELRSSLWTFEPGDHLTLAILDEWAAARDFLGRARVKRNPPRVNYAFFPSADARKLDLRHDHAYWVSGLRARDASGDPESDPARAEIDARSLAYGEGRPDAERYVTTDPDAGPAQLSLIEGTRWTGIPEFAPRNALSVRLENVRRSTVSGRRARLDGNRPLCVGIRSDGQSRLRLNLPLPADATVEPDCGGLLPSAGDSSGGGAQAAATASDETRAAATSDASLDRRGATFTVGSGEHEFLIAAAADGGGDGGPQGGPGGDGTGGGASGGGVEGAAGRTGPLGAGAGFGSGGGGGLPFTGLGLGALALIALALLTGGRALRAGSST